MISQGKTAKRKHSVIDYSSLSRIVANQRFDIFTTSYFYLYKLFYIVSKQQKQI